MPNKIKFERIIPPTDEEYEAQLNEFITDKDRSRWKVGRMTVKEIKEQYPNIKIGRKE
ncbi:MAG: hypothetical protein WC315_07065 [Candidatus Omnitrophota bacterium]|jgi:hypothetical protein